MDDRLNLFTEDLQQERQIKIEVDDTILYFNRAGAAITPRLYPDMCGFLSPVNNEVLQIVLVFLTIALDEFFDPIVWLPVWAVYVRSGLS